MKKVALNFICKNEAHCIQKMLVSSLPLIDMIVALDTGSTDGTIEIIKDFGKQHDTPTYVFEHPFDNFGSSRNRALQRLMEVVEDAGWHLNEVYGCWIDCDEEMEVAEEFSKEDLSSGIYMVRTVEGGMTYTKSLLFNLSGGFYWEGPVHEILRWNDASITVDLVKGIRVFYHRTGASWQKDLVEKYLYYAGELEKYVQDGHQQYRWIYNTAESFSAAAEECKEPTRSGQIRTKALQYYLMAGQIEDRGREDKFLLQHRIGITMQALQKDWADVEQSYLLAYEWKRNRAETLKQVISHYLKQENWPVAYLYAWFSKKEFHGKNPYDADNHIMIEEPLYQWRMLYFYYLASYLAGYRRQAATAFRQLKEVIKLQPAIFSDHDLFSIHANAPLIMGVRSAVNKIKKVFKSNHKPVLSYE